jgi:transcriptional regulator NrdR family protein
MPCKHTATKCIDSRARRAGGDAYRTRRYQCLDCGLRFSTVEVPVELTPKVPGIKSLRAELGLTDEQRAAIAHLIEVFVGGGR